MTSLGRNAIQSAISVRPNLWKLALAGVSLWIALTIIFNAYGWIFACHRSDAQGGQCELTEMTGVQSHTERFNLSDLKKAEAVTLPSKAGTDYTIFLHMSPSDKMPTGIWGEIDYSNSGEQFQVAEQINAFLNNSSQQVLIINRDERFGSYALATTLLGIGVWMFISAFRLRSKSN